MKKFYRWIPVLIVVVVAWAAIARAQDVRDWFAYRSFEPSSEIAALAVDTDMSNEGRRLFYASHPQLNDRQAFNVNCPFPERSLVLGCYSSQKIFIFNVDDPRLAGVEEVTAAHEMLHAVYDRLSSSAKANIDQLVMEAFSALDDERLNETVEEYRASDPSVVANELHSILGTEHRQLPAELEEHYEQYFNDRQAVLTIAEAYEEVFVELQDDIARLDAQIGALKTDIEDLEAKLESTSAFLNQEADRLDRLLADDKISAYNAAVPGYNSTVNEFNSTIGRYQNKVDQHNALVEQRNGIAVEQNSLVQSLDSKFSPIVNE